MRRLWPLTLWRSVAVEIFRVTAIASTILVAVIAFALTVKFFADGRLGPIDTLRFMGLACIPMLQYALPFAAAFAATLVYHRMVQDNETIAAFASGLSRRSLLVPAAAVGLAFTTLLALLIHWVIPRFLLSMERVARAEVASIISNAVNRGESIDFGRLRMFADQVRQLPIAEEGGPDHRLQLLGFVVLHLDAQGGVERDLSARSCIVDIHDEETDEQGRRGTIVRFVIEDPVPFDRTFRGLRPSDPIRRTEFLPAAFKDDPKFLTLTELQQVGREPDRMSFVRERSRDLAFHLGWRELESLLQRELTAGGSTVLVARSDLFQPMSTRVTVHASAMRWDPEKSRYELLPATPGQPVRVERTSAEGPGADATRPTAVMLAQRAAIEANFGGDDASQRDLSLTLVLEDYQAQLQQGMPPARLDRLALTDLRPMNDPLPQLLATPARQLLARAQDRIEGPGQTIDTFLAGPTKELRRRLADLAREVFSKQQERWAFAAACAVMVIGGSVVALRLRDRMPLVVYLWAFFPALLVVVTISAGQQITHQTGPIGLLLLWGGVIALAAHTVASARQARG